MSDPRDEDKDRLAPARRGDRTALPLIVAAAVGYCASVGGFYASGLVNWGDLSPALRVLNGVGFALTVFAIIWSFARDWQWLRREEDDIQFVLHEGRDHLELVLLDPARRAAAIASAGAAGDHPGAGPIEDAKVEALRNPRVETLLDDRVLRVLRRAEEGEEAREPLRGGELRVIALSRAAGIGDAARYVSTLLLLLTVLGTFLGVKASLPGLVDALDLAGQGADAAVAGERMQGALREVASAFGANLNALLGSIALGLVAFALGTGRHSMLARLEQASSLYVYKRVGQTVATSNFTAALLELRGASRNLEGIAANLAGLGDSLGGLSETVESSLNRTTETLDQILSEQKSSFLQENNRSIERIEKQLTEVVLSVQHATALYETIAGALGQRSEALGSATERITQATDELRSSREAFGTFASSATTAIAARLGELEASVREQTGAALAVSVEYQQIRAGVSDLAAEARTIAADLGRAEEERRSAFQEMDHRVADAVAARLEQATSRLADAVADAVRVGMADMAARQPSPPTPAPAVDTGAALERLAHVLEALEASGGRDQPVGSPTLAPETVEHLTRTLQALERQLSRPLWRRLFTSARSASPNGRAR